MLEYKQSSLARLPVRLLDSTGTPVTGIPFSSVLVTIEKSTGVVAPVPVAPPEWVEITAGAFLGAGKYTLLMTPPFTDTAGVFSYAVKVPGAVTYVGLVKIVSTEAVDLRRLAEGRWKIFDTGPDANRLVLYSSDGSTVLQKWDLKDAAGAPTTVDVFERVPTTIIP